LGNRRKKLKITADQLVASAALLLTLVLSLPAWPLLAKGVAVVSVAAVLPESGVYYLRQRFAPEVQPYLPPQVSPLPQPEVEKEETPPLPPAAQDPPDQQDEPIPTEYRGTLLHETILAEDDGTWLNLGNGWLRNYTALSFDDILSAVEQTPLLSLQNSPEPQVLILHTHATESYEAHSGSHYDTRSSWRTRNNDLNMCAIGDVVALQLEQAGIAVVHNTTQHDYPSYNGSYDRSRQTAEEIMAEYPNIKVILDIHRDAIQRDQTTIVAPVTTINGQDCAQVMLIVGCDDGSLNMPNWQQNLRFGVELQNRLEQQWPTLARPLFFAHRKYNQDMAPGALLIEMGASGNTFEQAERSAHMVGQTLAQLLAEMEEN